jgi:hypothetical protein
MHHENPHCAVGVQGGVAFDLRAVRSLLVRRGEYNSQYNSR